MRDVPNELWLRIFSGIGDGKTLIAITLVSHSFYGLGMEVLIRRVVWKNGTVALSHLDFWARNPDKRRCVRGLKLHYHEGYKTPFVGNGRSGRLLSPAESQSLCARISSFSMLKHLTLSHGFLPEDLFQSLQLLQNLTHLTIKYCCVPVPPLSTPIPITVSTLCVSNLYTQKPDPAPTESSLFGDFIPNAMVYDVELNPIVSPHFIHILPHLHTLTASRILERDISDDAAARLASFTINEVSCTGHATVTEIWASVRRMSQLKRLHIDVERLRDRLFFYHSWIPFQPQGSFPRLQTIYGPGSLVASVLPGANALAQVVIMEPLAGTVHALDLITALIPLPVHTVALSLQKWDEKVLIHMTQSLPQCERLELLYFKGRSRPTKKFLHTVGKKYLKN
ncbi:hypothetical protein DFH07DRAFT_797784 [Mycena maculata]|uniref:F-box domain-containing protein n=1 Tax=Mycena maculata TaxID=230809 RepID=A0AAD7K274_9AGAR|nr:hypothetical protein DFH07DRAFT_797784 [Mycena maculata]